jgi:formate dehydrogenase subunit gamma
MPEPVKTSATRLANSHQVSYSVIERQALAARACLKTDKLGNAYVVRFPLLVRVLHGMLLISITVLAFTGLAQILHGNFLGSFMLRLLGGLDETQGIHHAFSILLGIVVLFHLLDILESIFVRRQTPGMIPASKDLTDAWQMLKFNLGISRMTPSYGKFSFEQKAVYLVVSLGVLVQGLTGLLRLFPVQVTEFLPGILVVYAGILHRWNAILVILVVFVWHLYQVHIRQHNLSIFTGRMSYDMMKTEHPLEFEYLQKAAAIGISSGMDQLNLEPEGPNEEKNIDLAPTTGVESVQEEIKG